MSRPTLTNRQVAGYIGVAALAFGVSLAGVPYVGLLTTPLALWATISKSPVGEQQ